MPGFANPVPYPIRYISTQRSSNQTISSGTWANQIIIMNSIPTRGGWQQLTISLIKCQYVL